MDEYQKYIAKSRYARWLPEKTRREEFHESVDRYLSYWEEKYEWLKNDEEWKEAKDLYHNLSVVGSMRALMTAGKALDRDHIAGFNCSFRAIEGGGKALEVLTDDMKEAGFQQAITVQVADPTAFDEIMYVLLCGTGVGFTVERQFINSLPVIGHKLPRGIYKRNEKNFPGVPVEELSTYSTKYNRITVADSKYGWASALRILLVELYNGNFDVQIDVSAVREAGAQLKTFGGRASGPEPLVSLYTFTVGLFKKAAGRKLTSVECHDLVCKIAEIVVVGGVRRSALISLSNLTDRRMATAKSGAWWENDGQRALANNSTCYTEKPDIGIFMQEWLSLYESKSGERGIFSRVASQNKAAENGRRDPSHPFGTNPCSEIILRSQQLCNLSEVVVREKDTMDSLLKKIRAATIFGTLQATLTNFRYVNKEWTKNTEEEALLGVSLTGIMDNKILGENSGKLPAILQDMRQEAIDTNKRWAKKLHINQAAAITCVKPSGTVSQLVNSASGIHPRYSPYYIRTVRADKKDPMTQFMIDNGFPHEDDITEPTATTIFSFPIQSPKGSVYRDDRSAVEQLELWLTYMRHWCEHKPSITVYVKEHEWMEVGAWVYEHFDEVSGVSFLPHTDHTYAQAPYQEIDKEEYDRAVEAMPKDVDWTALGQYEHQDMTEGSQELACTAGSCEVI